MAGPSFTQSSFLGGEFGSYASGRIDLPDYLRALALSYNGLPIEEGAWCRRAGTWMLGPTWYGQEAEIREIVLGDGNIVILEFSRGTAYGPTLRLWTKPYAGPGADANGNAQSIEPVPDMWGQIIAISTANPAVMTVQFNENLTLQAGDVVIPYIDPTTPPNNAPQINRQQLKIGTPTQVGPAGVAPTLSSVAGGALGPATRYVKTTYVSSGAEGGPSAVASLDVLVAHLLQVASPAAKAGADHYNIYATALIDTPASPTTGSTAGGTLAAATYYIRVTIVNAQGETLGSAETSQAVAVNNLLTVSSPPVTDGATGWNVYVSTATGTETRQNGITPIVIGTGWTEPTTGLVAGTALPVASTATFGTYTLQNASPIALGTAWTEPTTGLTATGVAPPAANSSYSSFTISDMLTGAGINGAILNFSGTGSVCSHIWHAGTPYKTSALHTMNDLRVVPMYVVEKAVPVAKAAIFAPGNQPQLLELVLPTLTNGCPTLSFGPLGFSDGPWLDPLPGNSQTGNSIGQVSAVSITNPTFTITDGAYAFLSTDLNRYIRLWTQPAAWSSTTAYVAGNAVTSNGQYWLCAIANTNIAPSVTAALNGAPYWTLAPNLAYWYYAQITAVISTTTVQLQAVPIPGASVVQAGNQPSNGTTIDTWQLGAYYGTQWPTAATWADGRLWMVGGIENRIDASTDDPFGGNSQPGFLVSSPTDEFGNVLDSSGISIYLNSDINVSLRWIAPHFGGLVAGSADAEYRIFASSLNEAITPTTVQIQKSTAWGSHKIPPLSIGNAFIFAQTVRRKVVEYFSDLFSRKWIGRHINEYSRNLTAARIRWFAYVEEPSPTIWASLEDGTLLSCTYRRLTNWPTSPPEFSGWSHHALGSGWAVHSICRAPVVVRDEGIMQSIALVTVDTTPHYYIEVLRPIFQETNLLTDAWQLDDAFVGNEFVATSSLLPVCTPAAAVVGGGGASLIYFEFTINQTTEDGSSISSNDWVGPGVVQIGFCNANFVLSDPTVVAAGQTLISGRPLGWNDANSMGFFNTGHAGNGYASFGSVNGEGAGVVPSITPAGKVYQVELDLTHTQWRVRDDADYLAGQWSNWLPISGFFSSTFYFAATMAYSGGPQKITVNTGAQPFSFPIPAGYVALDPSGATTWGAAGAGITLSNGNLSASSSISADNNILYGVHLTTGLVLQ